MVRWGRAAVVCGLALIACKEEPEPKPIPMGVTEISSLQKPVQNTFPIARAEVKEIAIYRDSVIRNPDLEGELRRSSKWPPFLDSVRILNEEETSKLFDFLEKSKKSPKLFASEISPGNFVKVTEEKLYCTVEFRLKDGEMRLFRGYQYGRIVADSVGDLWTYPATQELDRFFETLGCYQFHILGCGLRRNYNPDSVVRKPAGRVAVDSISVRD